MTTNTAFRQYLGCIEGNRYAIRLRTHARQRYASARIIAEFPTYDEMFAAWQYITDLEGYVYSECDAH